MNLLLVSAALAGDVAEAHQALLLGQESLTAEEKHEQNLAFEAAWKILEDGYPDQALASFRAGEGYPAAVGEAVVLVRMERWDEAGLRLQRLPGDDEVLYLSAWVWMHQGYDVAAVALLVQVEPTSPIHADALTLARGIEGLPRRWGRKKALAELAPLQLQLRLDGEDLVPYVDP